MNSLILIITIIVALGGLFISIQTIVQTRNRYYQEFIQRKKDEIKEKNKSLGYLQDNKIITNDKKNINSKNDGNEKT